MTARPSYTEALACIAATAQKTNSGAPGYSRWVNRPLGRRVAALAVVMGLTPNQLTAMNGVLIFPVIFILPLIRPVLFWNVLAAFILLAGYVLDSADGQLARFRGGGTKVGEWIDHVLDGLKTSLLHAVILVIWYRFYLLDSPLWLLIPISFGVIAPSYFFALMLADDLRLRARLERGESLLRVTEAANLQVSRSIRSLILLPNDWGVMCVVLVLLPFQWVFIVIYSFLLFANTVFIVVGSIRWCQELATFDEKSEAS